MAALYLGMARARLGPAAALIDTQRGIAACEENRLTRARQAPTVGGPDLAIAELLSFLGRPERDITETAVVRDEDTPPWSAAGTREVAAHQAHAEYAFRASGFDSALVVTCDASVHKGWSAWHYRSTSASDAVPLDVDAGDFPIARIYSELTAALNLQPARDEHLVEAMARAGADRHPALADAIAITDAGLQLPTRFRELVADTAQGDASRQRDVAASVQRRLGECLVELLRRLAHASGARNVCLSGGLFFNTDLNTTAAHCGLFERTLLPAHPGRSGSAMGAALIVAGAYGASGASGANGASGAYGAYGASGASSAYLGPGYDAAQINATLENCKLSFDLQRDEQVVDTVLRAVSKGRLVGWFHGRLEWGPRALGHRTVLADPFSPYVLDNLNGYLKKRPAYRTYGVSVPLSRLGDLFEVPAGLTGPPQPSPYMQYEYTPRDLERFRTLLPDGATTVRVHSVGEDEPRYLRLLERWGEMSGTPALVNTSFNGFHEPLVCSPRDAIRVFYGTGLDLLALEGFVLRK